MSLSRLSDSKMKEHCQHNIIMAPLELQCKCKFH